LDFLDENSESVEFLALKELEIDNSQYKSLSDLPKLMNTSEDSKARIEDFATSSLNDMISLLQTTTNRFTKAVVLHELVNRYGFKMQIHDLTVYLIVFRVNYLSFLLFCYLTIVSSG